MIYTFSLNNGISTTNMTKLRIIKKKKCRENATQVAMERKEKGRKKSVDEKQSIREDFLFLSHYQYVPFGI